MIHLQARPSKSNSHRQMDRARFPVRADRPSTRDPPPGGIHRFPAAKSVPWPTDRFQAQSSLSHTGASRCTRAGNDALGCANSMQTCCVFGVRTLIRPAGLDLGVVVFIASPSVWLGSTRVLTASLATCSKITHCATRFARTASACSHPSQPRREMIRISAGPSRSSEARETSRPRCRH